MAGDFAGPSPPSPSFSPFTRQTQIPQSGGPRGTSGTALLIPNCAMTPTTRAPCFLFCSRSQEAIKGQTSIPGQPLRAPNRARVPCRVALPWVSSGTAISAAIMLMRSP